MKLTKHCEICNKKVEVSSESKVLNLVITQYSCGHVRAKAPIKPKDLDVTSIDGKKPFKYQLDGASWGASNGARVLIADEMGVGKTLQAFLIAKSDPKEYLPILIVCKSALKVQMQQEAFRWCDWFAQVIDNDCIIPKLPCYIISYDNLAHHEFKNRRGKTIHRGIQDLDKLIEKINPRLIILDECQKIKNVSAKRTKAVQQIARHPQYVIALSGTPVENNAAEYFPILNIIHPEKFPSREGFIARWCDSYFTGYTQKVGGIKDPKAWKEFTKNFIIRRTRAEVLPDLPTIDRRFRFEELGDKVAEAYKKTLQDFQNYYYYGSQGQTTFQKEGNILAYLAKMRHLTGIAKIPGVVDFVQEFIEDTDRKIVIFTHHKDVASEIVARIREFYPNVLELDAPVNPATVDKFWQPNYRVMQASTLAGGEGLNLQCCSDCIMVERQWNPPKEEQAEARFPRPGQLSDKISATYFVAIGTVDEFFADLVEQKRAIFASTMDGKQIQWNESSLIRELAEILAAKGGKKWGI